MTHDQHQTKHPKQLGGNYGPTIMPQMMATKLGCSQVRIPFRSVMILSGCALWVGDELPTSITSPPPSCPPLAIPIPTYTNPATNTTQVLWLGEHHTVTEVGAMNLLFFWVNEQGEEELVTAPLHRGDILPGAFFLCV